MNGQQLSFLADESCDFGVVRALRSEGHDVFAVAEMMSRSNDRELIDFAAGDERILITEDKDFGWLVHVARAKSNGVIFIGFPGTVERMLELWSAKWCSNTVSVCIAHS